MSKGAEHSLQLKIRKAHGFRKYLFEFKDYNPRNAAASVASYDQLVESIDQANGRIAVLTKKYNEAVLERLQLFKGEKRSVDAILPLILEEVQKQYGQRSAEFLPVKALINSMWAHSLLRPIQDFNRPDIYKEILRFETAYKIKQGYLQELTELVKGFSEYCSQHPLQMNELQVMERQIEKASNRVRKLSRALVETYTSRIDLFEKLREKIRLVKACTKFQYGGSSPEYTLIRNIKV